MSEHIDVFSRGDVQVHWEQNTPINDELRRIVEGVTNRFSFEMQEELAASTPTTRHEMIRAAGNVYNLPYGRIGNLPPALFGDINMHAAPRLTRSLVIPHNDAEIDTMATRYVRWATGIAYTRRYMTSAFPDKQILRAEMSKHQGIEYPLDHWQIAANAMHRALREEPNFTMDSHRTNKMGNAAFDYDQLNDATKAMYRPYESYALVMSKKYSNDTAIPDTSTRDTIQLPIGKYGQEAAAKLARITVALNDFIKTSPMIDAGVRNRLTSADQSLLAQHTARSRERKALYAHDYAVHGIKNTLTEGVLTVAQVLSFLTAENINGYKDHDALVRDILETDIVEQFTRVVRPGYIGPTTLSGIYLPGAIVVCDGKPTFNKEMAAELNRARREHAAGIMAEWATYRANGGVGAPPNVLALVCPAAAPNGAISIVKNVIKAFYRQDMDTAA